MLTFTKNKLVIIMEHPQPEAYIKDLKTALIFALQHMEIAAYGDLIEIKETNYTLLELLKRLE